MIFFSSQQAAAKSQHTMGFFGAHLDQETYAFVFRYFAEPPDEA